MREGEPSRMPPAALHPGDAPPQHAVDLSGVESGSGKRKAPAAPTDRDHVDDEEVLEIACEDTWRISGEIESLKSQLDWKVKELEYCKENKQLRVELAVKSKEMESLRKLNQDLKARIENLEKHLEGEEQLIGELVAKERESNEELQEARKELAAGFTNMFSGRSAIGIKRLGALDLKPFRDACKKKHGDDEHAMRAEELVARWEEEIKKLSWHPFKIIQVDGKIMEVIRDDDPQLQHLLTEYGDGVCNAVKTALMELNEHNPSGRHVLPELWNFRENRKASTKEVVKYVFERLGRKRRV